MWEGILGIPTWLCIAAPCMVLFYINQKSKQNKLRRAGIPGPDGWMFIGDMKTLIDKGIMQYDVDLRKQYGKIVSYVMMGTQHLQVYDLDLLKEITIKQFHHFQNHTNRKMDIAPFRKMLTMLESEHWRHVRTTLSPTFSGGKLRQMNASINKCCKTWTSHLQRTAESGSVTDFKQQTEYLTMDMIASVAFGLDIDAQHNPENDFVKYAKIIMSMRDKFTPSLLLYMIFPRLAIALKINIVDPKCLEFFGDVVTQTMELRKNAEEASSKDFLQLMINSYKGEPKKEEVSSNPDLKISELGHVYSKTGLTREEIESSALLFFLAGFETTAMGISHLCYNLALYPECQEKLHKEISDVMSTSGQDEPDYDLIKKMPYLSMCVDETLRMYPPAARTDRQTNEDIVINGIAIPKGTIIALPIWAIHRDPENYPEPDKFIPERFSEEEKAARHSMAYMPFGQGPRMCIGNRLALMEMKFAVIHLMMKFKVMRCEETQVPLKHMKLRLQPQNGIKVKLEFR